ncbi:MAG TPA: hypothetical protein VFX48_01170 [Saprospiraceae bacterium]|nr:hypothetical protein [Saprospiraceae bacterium]
MSDPLKQFLQQSRSRLDLDDPNPELFSRILRQLEQQKAHTPNRFPWSRKTSAWLAAAASVVLLVSVWSLIERRDKHPGENPIMALENPELKQPVPTAAPAISEDPGSQSAEEVSALIPSNHENNTSRKSSVPKPSVAALPAKVMAAEPRNEERQVILEVETEDPVAIVQETLTEPAAFTTAAASTEIGPQPMEVRQPASEIAALSLSDPTGSNPGPMKSNVAAKDHASMADSEEEDQSIQSALRKGFFKFLSRKAKKWSGDALNIETTRRDDQSILALHYKNENFEFSKAIPLNKAGH